MIDDSACPEQIGIPCALISVTSRLLTFVLKNFWVPQDSDQHVTNLEVNIRKLSERSSGSER